MAGRSEAHEPIKKLLRVVERDLMPMIPDRTSAANFGGSNGAVNGVTTAITKPGTNGSGDTITRHVFMLDLDAMDDSTVYLA